MSLTDAHSLRAGTRPRPRALANPPAPVLAGAYERRLDHKGRLVLPIRFHEVLGDPLFLARGPGRSLLVLHADHWHSLAAQRPTGLFVATSYQLSVDRTTGRVLIPRLLREHAGFVGYSDVVVLGRGRLAQIGSYAWYREVVAGREPLGPVTLRVSAVETIPA